MITKEEAEYIFENLAYRKKTYKEMSSEFNVHTSTLCKWMNSFKKEFGIENDEKYSANTFLRYKYKDEIIKKYNNGESTSAIAKYLLSDEISVSITVVVESPLLNNSFPLLSYISTILL